MQKTVDMTHGRPIALIGSFALPLFVGNVFQMLYGVADSAVIGRVLGVDAFAAVGAAGFYSWLVTDIILGFTQGFGVLLGQRFGGKDEVALRRAVAMSILLSALLALVLTATAQAAAAPVLRALDTPDELRDAALVYLRWVLAGVPVSVAANLAASLLRALGNSRAPVTAMAVAGVCNVCLDLLFASVLHGGVAGVATATVAAQMISLGLCLFALRGVPAVRPAAKDFLWDSATAHELLRLGLPPAVRNGVISLGGLLVQRQINRYGRLFVAGFTAAQKYYDLMNLTGGALEGAFATYSAQNYGAGDLPHLKVGLRVSVAAALTGSTVSAAVVILLRRRLIGLLISGAPEELEEVLQCGSAALLVMALFLPALYLLCLYRAGLQGMGDTLFPTLSGLTELLLRLAAVVLLPARVGRWGVYLASPLGWAGGFVLLAVAWHAVFRARCAEAGRPTSLD